MKKHKITLKFTSLIIAIVMTLTTLVGCASGAKESSNGDDNSVAASITTKEIADSISEAIRKEVESQEEWMNISFDPDDYAGDLDAFVYGLIVTEYKLCYNVFNASIELSDGEMVYGIGYTDYAERYDSDDGKIFFPAGFIALIGEPEIPKSEIENGLEIFDLECEDDEHGFVLAYDTDPFTEHCVIWGQYLQYGVDDDGSITYKAEEFDGENYDETIGNLYSYDDSKFILNFDQGEYTPLTGVSLSEQIDFAELEAEVNKIIEEQNKNFQKAEIETIVAEAPERLEAALLSMQTETFMGYEVSELIEMTKDLDPMECIRFTPDGAIVVNVSDEMPQTSAALTKWLVGITCVMLVIGSVAIDLFVKVETKDVEGTKTKPLDALSGAIAGAAIEVFVQVVLDNYQIEDINWKKVAIASCTGAIIASMPGIIKKATGKIGNEFAKYLAESGLGTISDALLLGMNEAIFSMIDEKEVDEVFDSFKTGCIIGASFSVGCKILGKIGGKVVKKVLERSKPNSWIGKMRDFGNRMVAFIGKHQIVLADSSEELILNPKTYIEATRVATKELRKANEVLDIKRMLPSDANKNFILTDSNGNIMTKSEFIKNGGDGFIMLKDTCDKEIRALFEKYNLTEISVNKGFADLSSFSSYFFKPNKTISENRKTNMDNYYDDLAKKWSVSTEDMPEALKRYFSENNLAINKTNIKDALAEVGYRLHEGADGMVYMIDKEVHDVIPHSGGVLQAKIFAKIDTAVDNLSYLSEITVNSITGTLLNTTA